MNKGLEALKRMYEHLDVDVNYDDYAYEIADKDFDTIKKELKEAEKNKQVLEIIGTKDFIDLKLLRKCKTHYEYNRQVAQRYDSRGMDIGLLTQEEYNLLKEVVSC